MDENQINPLFFYYYRCKTCLRLIHPACDEVLVEHIQTDTGRKWIQENFRCATCVATKQKLGEIKDRRSNLYRVSIQLFLLKNILRIIMSQRHKKHFLCSFFGKLSQRYP